MSHLPYLCQFVPPWVGNNVGNMHLHNKVKLHTICTRIVKYHKRFLPKVVNLWNNLDKETVEFITVSSFKNKIVENNVCNKLYVDGTQTSMIGL